MGNFAARNLDRIVPGLAFLGGAAALAHQLLWTRRMVDILGATKKAALLRRCGKRTTPDSSGSLSKSPRFHGVTIASIWQISDCPAFRRHC